MERILFRVTEVAGFLGLSRAKTYELMKSGALPSVKLDGCRRIKADDLRRFVDDLPSEAA
ncbi:MAG TPA: helix-turn-helix domain-containing protein [Dermatophilaceae bacterium]|jgi:excisionase family DNA binding protein|nr:helix-turn-helix domain-containing protein [Dermatophilaceae bacterium]